MKVSVILTVLDEGQGMTRLLDALLAQSTQPDEFVIVDGGSTDTTLRVLHDYAARDDRFKIHVAPGVNIARGRNLAIARASGEIIAVTDGGCVPQPGWLKGLLEPMEADAGVGAVGGRFVPVAQNRFEHFCGLMSVPDLASESQRGMFYGRSSAFRRRLWERVGGYPEWLYTAEDTLFALGAGRLHDYRIVYAPASVLYWRPRANLHKLAKMFFLYGRGNGRIEQGELKGCLYWLRLHLALVLAVMAGLFQPWMLLLAGLIGWQMLRTIVTPNLRLLEDQGERSPDRFFFVPLIALTRNASTNLGFLRGWLDRRRDGDYKRKLDEYLKGPA